MGGRSWWYLTDYEGDAEAALQALRDRAFAAGEYVFEGEPPRTLAALLDAAAERGTGSILDVEATSPSAGAGVAVPASRLMLQAAFGTVTPTLAQVQDAALRLAATLPRWRCVYFPVFDRGVAVKWCFAGTSGETAVVRAQARRGRVVEARLGERDALRA